MTYPLYDPGEPCLKCGCIEARLTFKSPLDFDSEDVAKCREWLDVTCWKCGHMWVRAPLDSAPASAPEPTLTPMDRGW